MWLSLAPVHIWPFEKSILFGYQQKVTLSYVLSPGQNERGYCLSLKDQVKVSESEDETPFLVDIQYAYVESAIRFIYLTAK